MGEKVPTTKEAIGENTRSAIIHFPEGKPRTEEYNPSRSEKLLEEICRSFGTELEQAYVDIYNGRKLVRLSKPVVLTNVDTGERNLLVMQSTRFSPFTRDGSKIIEICKNKSKKKLDDNILEEIGGKIRERDGEWDPFREVTDNTFIPDVKLARWRKELYFAIFNLAKGQTIPEDMTRSFLIHEHRKGTPDIHATFYREPLFVKDGWVEKDKDVRDTLRVDFPKIHSRHNEAMGLALGLHPANAIESEKQPGKTLFTQEAYPTGFSYSLLQDMPINLTMGLIHSYLKRIVLGSSL